MSRDWEKWNGAKRKLSIQIRRNQSILRFSIINSDLELPISIFEIWNDAMNSIAKHVFDQMKFI